MRLDLRNSLHPLAEHDRIFEHLATAEALTVVLGDPLRHARGLGYLSVHFGVVGPRARALECADRALGLATQAGSAELELEMRLRVGVAHLHVDQRRTIALSREVIAALNDDLAASHRFGLSVTASFARALLARALGELGDFTEAVGVGAEAVRIAEALDHRYSLAYVCSPVDEAAGEARRTIEPAWTAVIAADSARSELRSQCGTICYTQPPARMGPAYRARDSMNMRAIKVVAVTQSDPFFTGRFFEAFLRESVNLPVRLIEIVLLRNFNESKPALALRLWKLYGSVDMARLFGRYASATIADRFGSPRSVEAIAAKHAIPVRPLATINDPAYLRTLGDRGVDVLLSVAAPQIFRSAALKAAPHVLNVHCGKLPEYRGMMPTFWAVHDGENQVVVTVHEMAEQLDAGGVLAEYPIPVTPADSAFDLAVRAKLLAGQEVARLLARLRTATWPQPQPVEMARQRYFRFPTRKHAQELRAAGRRML